MNVDDELALRVVELYYLEGMTQATIGERVGVTRWTIGRILEQARENGLVNITINHPHARDNRLERDLMDQFGIDRAIVVPTTGSTRDTLAFVAAKAAAELCSLRPQPKSIGISWGRTMAAVAAELPFRWNPNVQVVQTNGGVSRSADDAVAATIGVAAAKGPGRGYTVPAPTIVSSTTLAEALFQEPAIANTLQAAANADAIVYAPGLAHANSVLVRSDYLSAKDMAQLRKAGAVGDVLSHFVDVDGKPVDSNMDGRTISISLSALKAAKTTIAVACGPDRGAALAGVMRAGYARIIITDTATAYAALTTVKGDENDN